MAKDIKNVDDYINSFSDDKKTKLHELRKLINKTIPDAIEDLKWNNPAFIHSDGMILVIFAGYRQHINLVVTPSTLQAFTTELTDQTTGKGSLRLYYDKPLPTELIKKLISYRANEYKNHGVKWM